VLRLRLLLRLRRRHGAVAVASIDGEVSEDAVVFRPASTLRTIVLWRDQSVQIRSRVPVDSFPLCADVEKNTRRHRRCGDGRIDGRHVRRLRPGYDDNPRNDPVCHPG